MSSRAAADAVWAALQTTMPTEKTASRDQVRPNWYGALQFVNQEVVRLRAAVEEDGFEHLAAGPGTWEYGKVAAAALMLDVYTQVRHRFTEGADAPLAGPDDPDGYMGGLE